MALRKASRSSELFCDLTIWKGIADQTSNFGAGTESPEAPTIKANIKAK